MTPEIVIELENPTVAHGETITKLTFKPPVGRDLFEAGYPYKMQQDARNPSSFTRIFDMPACRALISRMAQVPTSTVDTLSFPDVTEALGVIAYFLAPSSPKPSSEAATK